MYISREFSNKSYFIIPADFIIPKAPQINIEKHVTSIIALYIFFIISDHARDRISTNQD